MKTLKHRVRCLLPSSNANKKKPPGFNWFRPATGSALKGVSGSVAMSGCTHFMLRLTKTLSWCHACERHEHSRIGIRNTNYVCHRSTSGVAADIGGVLLIYTPRTPTRVPTADTPVIVIKQRFPVMVREVVTLEGTSGHQTEHISFVKIKRRIKQ